MHERTISTRLAMALMGLITAFNMVLAVNFVVASGSGLARVFNGQNIYIMAGLQMVLVLLAYIACKYQPIQRGDHAGHFVGVTEHLQRIDRPLDSHFQVYSESSLKPVPVPVLSLIPTVLGTSIATASTALRAILEITTITIMATTRPTTMNTSCSAAACPG